MNLIGLGYKKGAGKDTVAKIIRHLLYTRRTQRTAIVHFADLLKEGIGKGIFGFSDEQCYGPLKDKLDPFWNMTPGYVFQKAGTEAMRATFGEDIWVKALFKSLPAWVEPEGYRSNSHLSVPLSTIIFSDVRFPNEAEGILQHAKQWGCVKPRLVKVLRETQHSCCQACHCQAHDNMDAVGTVGTRTCNHSSETSMDSYAGWTDVIHNNGSMDDLQATVEKFLRDANIL